MSTKKTLPPSYFETKYQADIDPWRFRTSAYEQENTKLRLLPYRSRNTKTALRSAAPSEFLQRSWRGTVISSSPRRFNHRNRGSSSAKSTECPV